VHALALWIVNLVLQLGVTVALLVLAGQLEEPWTSDYFVKNYGISITDATILLGQAVAANSVTAHPVPEQIVARCEKAAVVPYCFYGLMIFLWMVKNFAELEKSFLLYIRLLHVERRKYRSEVILSQDTSTIKKLDGWMVHLLVFLAPLTKSVIAVLVTYAGMKFLLLQDDELRVILKALCMKFVTQIDDMLLSLSTSRTRRALRKFHIQSNVSDPGIHNSVWDAGLGGLSHLAVNIIISVIVMHVAFGGMVNFRLACSWYLDSYMDGARSRQLFSWLRDDTGLELAKTLRL
jgi:hypothetical protein